MPRRKLNVAEVEIYRAPDGFRYTCRDLDNRVIYDSQQPFRSGRAAKDQAARRWPNARITFR